MASLHYQANIKGYWRDINKSGVPSHSGVYFVYEGHHNDDGTVTLLRLIYIGESGNVRSRIEDHEGIECWEEYVQNGNELCYSTCAVEPDKRERVEAAYIYKHQPLCNSEYKASFPYDTTRVISSGKTALINEDFTV